MSVEWAGRMHKKNGESLIDQRAETVGPIDIPPGHSHAMELEIYGGEGVTVGPLDGAIARARNEKDAIIRISGTIEYLDVFSAKKKNTEFRMWHKDDFRIGADPVTHMQIVVAKDFTFETEGNKAT